MREIQPEVAAGTAHNDDKPTAATDGPDVLETRILDCPRCKVPAQQVWRTVHLRVDGAYPSFHDDEDLGVVRRGHPRPRWKSSECQACREKSLWREGVVVYPVTSAAPAPHAAMPADVRELYDEAGQVLAISRRAGAALARAALERLVRELDVDGGPKDKLDDRIARLSKVVSTPLAAGLDIVRFIGNDSLHGSGDQELVYLYLSDTDPAVTMLMFETINELVDELLVRPKQTKALWDKLPQGVKAAIERKRKAVENP